MTISVATKIIRTFAFTFLGFFLPVLAAVAIKVSTDYEISGAADWNVAKVAVLAGMFGGFSASIRAVVAFLPILADDDVGLQKKP